MFGIVSRLPPAALAVLACAASLFSVRSTDLFWHLSTGRAMVENLTLPRQDPFRFGPGGGLPWVDHEWLFQLLVYGVERLGGLDALIALRTALVTALAALLYLAVRRTGGGRAVAAGLAAAALLGARPRFLVRPELFTFLAVAGELLLLRRLETDPRDRRTWCGLLALTVVWTNLHGLALLAPVLAGGYLLGVALAPASAGPPAERRAAWLAMLLGPAALAAAMLLNPYGVRVFAVAFGITGALADLAAVNPEWLPVWRAPQPMIFAPLVAAATALAALAVDSARRGHRIHLPTGLVTAGLAALALSAVRHQALFFVAGVFFAAETLAARRSQSFSVAREGSRRAESFATTVGVACACLLLAAWCLHPPATGPLAPRQGRFELSRGLAPHRFPETATAWLARHPGIGPLYNELAHGGYLLWHLHPPRQVFIDGRMELEPALLREIEAARTGDESWRSFLRRRGAAGALVRYDDRSRPVFATDPATGRPVPVARQTPNAALFPTESWALVYWDDDVMLFLDRAQSENRPFLEAEYAAVQPEDVTATLARAGADAAFRARALADVDRRLGEDPRLRRAAWLRDRLRALAPAGGVTQSSRGGPV